MGGTGHARAAVEHAGMSVARPTIRLQAAADIAPLGPDVVVADVATGRGELAIYLAASRRCARVIAVDNSPRAVGIAAAQVAHAGLTVPVELRLGDGLAPLEPGEAGVIFVTGIGGRLMVRLLAGMAGEPAHGHSGGLARLLGPMSGPVVVLQPMSEPKLLRRWAESRGRELGYLVAAERLVKDAGRYYHVFLLERPAPQAAPRPEDGPAEAILAAAGTIAWEEVGPYLLAEPDPLLLDYLVWRQAQLEALARTASAGCSKAGFRRAGAALTVLAALARLEVALRQALDSSP